jgi:transposase-like protein
MAAAPRRTPEERSRLLAEWKATGLSAAEFAPRVGVTAHTLYAWRPPDSRGPRPER